MLEGAAGKIVKMNESDQLLDSVLRREIEFQQTATWLLIALAADLKQLKSEIVGRFYLAPITTMTQATVALLMVEVSDAIDKAYDEIRRRMEQWADDLINVAEEDEKKRTFIAFGWVLPTLSGFTAESLIIQGLSLKDAIQKNADALKFKFKTELNMGTLSDETPDAVLRRVLGLEQFETSAFDLTLNGLETIARTAATTIPAQVKIAQQEAASAQGGASGAETRIFWSWIALLDMRTCKVCMALHEKRFDDQFNPIGHTLQWQGGPPRHYACRCSCISLPVGAPAPGEVGFVEWINRQSLDELAQIFGGELAKEIKAGKVTQANIARGGGLSRNPKEL